MYQPCTTHTKEEIRKRDENKSPSMSDSRGSILDSAQKGRQYNMYEGNRGESFPSLIANSLCDFVRSVGRE